MAMQLQLARRVRRELADLSTAGLDSTSLTVEVEKQLRAVVPFDRACWHNVDPATSMVTSVMGDSALDDPLLAVIEYADADVNSYASLARAVRPAATLRQATDDVPRRSRRYREVLQPMGLDDELTASFVDDATLWGCVRLYRQRGQPVFDAAEVAYMAALSPLLADSYRRALLAPSSAGDGDRSAAPGIVILDDQDRLEAITPAAERWLVELVDIPRSASTPLPHPLYVLAAITRAAQDGASGRRPDARSRLRTRSGRWLVLHGSRLTGGRSPRTAIVIEPAPSPETGPIIAQAFGLTERERDVVQQVVSGFSNKEIAVTLGLSPYTVGDHLKAAFEKAGVGSRGELIARIFFEQYLPRLTGERPAR